MDLLIALWYTLAMSTNQTSQPIQSNPKPTPQWRGQKLQGQVAIVTGGGRGIGAAAALRLAAAGAAVVIAARSADQVENVAAQIRADGGRAIGVETDVSNLADVEETVESALDQFGRIDMLLNNAAIVWPVDEVAETDPEEWAYNIHVNLIGPVYLANNVLPIMLEQSYGRILNVGSGADSSPIPGASAYCAAKAGLYMFTRVLAQEMAQSGITVNYLSPGMVDTEMQADIRSVDTSESGLDLAHFHTAHEEGRLHAPEMIAEYIYWLFGPWSRTHNGERFEVGNAAWTEQVRRDLGLSSN